MFGSGRREGLLAVLTLLLVSITLHAPGLFLGSPRGPAAELRSSTTNREAFTNRDTVLPALRAAGKVTRAGELPLWNPKSRLGEPFPVTGVSPLYPPFWLLMLHGSQYILDLLLCLHTFLACMCMYRFCRVVPLSRYAGFIGGALYGLGWFLTAQLDRLPDAAAAALLPLAMEFSWRMLRSRRREIYGGWLSLIVALLFSTGGTGVALLGVCLCLAMILNGIRALDQENKVRTWKALGVTTLLASLFTAPIWIQYLELAPLLRPATLPTAAHLQLAGLAGTLTPSMFGGLGVAPTEGLQMVNAHADPLELVLFPGTIVLFVGLLGLLRPKRTSDGLFWIFVGGLGLILSLDTPIAEMMYKVVPATVARPGISLLLVHVAFVVLGATSLERFLEAPVARPFAVPVTSGLTLAGCAALLLFGYVFPATGQELVGSFVSGTPDELTQALLHVRRAMLPTLGFGMGIAVLFLLWRRMGLLWFKAALEVLVLADLLLVANLYTPRLEANRAESHLTARIPEQSGRAVVVGRDKAVSATPLLQADTPTITTTTTAILSRTADLLGVIDPSVVLVDHRARVLPLQSPRLVNPSLLEVTGVGIVLTGHPYRFEGFASVRPAPAGEVAPKEDGGGYIHYRERELARAQLRFAAILAADRDEALEAVRNRLHELGKTVVLEGADPAFTCRRPGGPTSAEIVDDGANRVRIKVDAGDGQGYLVLADAYAPGWTATLDGLPAAVRPANLALRAVAIPPGAHEVVFTYEPMMVKVGGPMALLALLLLLCWFKMNFNRDVKRKPMQG